MKKDTKEKDSKVNSKENAKKIKGAKSEAIEDKKDNYEKKPSDKLKKKRTTSDGHMR